jgi:AcrR family transcriptional regulator
MTETAPKRKRAATVTRRYGGMDAAERRRERQRKLIDAGLEVFGTRGYHLATVRELCGASGLTERYFYESFKTVGELFDAVYLDLRSQLQQRIMAAVLEQGMKTRSPLDMGQSTLRAWLSYLQEDPRRARIMLVDAVSVSDSGMRGAEEAITEFKGMLRMFVSMMYPELHTTGFDMDVLIAALAGATIYIAKDWIRSGFKMSIDDVLRHNMAIFGSLDGLYQKTREAAAKPPTSPASLTPDAKPKSRRPSGA